MFYWVTNTGEIGCTNNPEIEPLIYGIKSQYEGNSPIEFIILTMTNVFMFGHFNGVNIETTSINNISLSLKDNIQIVHYVDIDIKGEEITNPLTYLQKNIDTLNNVAVIFPNIDKNKAFSIKYNKIEGFNNIEQTGIYANLYKWFKSNNFEIPFYDNEFVFVAHKGVKYCNVFGSDATNDELAISIQI